MHKHESLVIWERKGQVFSDNKYSRAHQWQFDGVTVPASSSPSVLPPPLSTLDAIDPEEALVAATASCHMLFFLAIAAKRGFIVERYSDAAYGEMGKNTEGRIYMSKITLRPSIEFSGSNQPSDSDIDAIHHEAHKQCFIGNSVNSEIVIQRT